MSDEVVENWQHEIRKLAPLIEKAMYHVHEKEADVKQLQAKLKLRAVDQGIKTNSGQETYAEATEELHEARLKVGVAKGTLEAIRVQLKSLEIGYEVWRTREVSQRKEQSRYGA
jgi:hypothetical protein|tara:strand:+ start:702 stop:1043 length:342 start_codon:yes stop_codon:yes gene_type:complete